MRSQHRPRSAATRRSAETLITPGHPRWGEFLDRLTGPLGLDVRGGGWHCAGGEDKRQSRRILLAMGLSPSAVASNLAFFEHHGGYCDCEVWMNVERSVLRGDPAGATSEDEPWDMLNGDGIPWEDGW